VDKIDIFLWHVAQIGKIAFLLAFFFGGWVYLFIYFWST